MNPQTKLETLMGGIGGLLVLASLVGFVLSRRATSDSGRAVVQNLNSRIKAWWIMVAVLGLALVLGRWVTILLFAMTSYFALREFVTLTPSRRGDHAALAVSFFALIPAQYGLIAGNWYGLFAVFIPVYAFLLLPALTAAAGDTEHFLERSSKLQWGVMVAVYCVSHAPALMLLHIPGYEGQNALLLCFMIVVVQLSDVLQYVCGKLFGKTKLAPQVSPSKTVEGLIGGGLGATLAGAGLWWITPFTLLQALGMAFIVVIAGFIGGLVLSAIKRSLGAKDWGTMIEGHGGMFDRIDSISFAAPLFFHLTRYFFSVS